MHRVDCGSVTVGCCCLLSVLGSCLFIADNSRDCSAALTAAIVCGAADGAAAGAIVLGAGVIDVDTAADAVGGATLGATVLAFDSFAVNGWREWRVIGCCRAAAAGSFTNIPYGRECIPYGLLGMLLLLLLLRWAGGYP